MILCRSQEEAFLTELKRTGQHPQVRGDVRSTKQLLPANSADEGPKSQGCLKIHEMTKNADGFFLLSFWFLGLLSVID